MRAEIHSSPANNGPRPSLSSTSKVGFTLNTPARPRSQTTASDASLPTSLPTSAPRLRSYTGGSDFSSSGSKTSDISSLKSRSRSLFSESTGSFESYEGGARKHGNGSLSANGRLNGMRNERIPGRRSTLAGAPMTSDLHSFHSSRRLSLRSPAVPVGGKDAGLLLHRRRASSRDIAQKLLRERLYARRGTVRDIGEVTEEWEEEENPLDQTKLHRRFVCGAQIVLALLKLYRRAKSIIWHSAAFSEQKDVLDKPIVTSDTTAAAFFDVSQFKTNRQIRITEEARHILSKDPEERTEEEVNYACIALRGIQLIADYPARMQTKLAAHGRFATYESGRMIVREGKNPEAFYFILYGTVIVAVLNESGKAETQCYLQRGDSFGELSIISRSARQSTVICKNTVDVLIIDTETYEKIFMVGGIRNLSDPDHEEFIKSLTFLQGWPIELLTPDPNIMICTYFKRNAVIVKDSNYSKWLFVIKSGSVRVLKKLARRTTTLHSRSGAVSRPVSRLDLLLAFQTNEPELNHLLAKCGMALPTASYPSVDAPNPDLSSDPDAPPSRDPTTRVIQRAQSAYAQFQAERQGLLKARPAARAKSAHPKHKPKTPEVPSGRRTYLDDLDAEYKEREQIVTEADVNPEFVHIQTLTKGDVFGLSSLLFPDQPGCCLYSNGADCILINRHFYRDHCPNKFLMNLRHKISPYPSDEKLQEDLQTQVNWDAYKKLLLQNLSQPKTVLKL